MKLTFNKYAWQDAYYIENPTQQQVGELMREDIKNGQLNYGFIAYDDGTLYSIEDLEQIVAKLKELNSQ